MKFLPLALMGTAVLVAGANTPASAAPVTFHDRSAWTAATSDVSTITFEGIAPFGGFVPFTHGPSTIGDVTFSTDAETFMFVVDPAFGPAFYDWNSGAVLNVDFGTPNVLTSTLPPKITAVGFDVMTFDPYAATVNVTVDDGGVASFNVPTLDFPIRRFFGIITESPITSIEIAGATLGVNIDNYSFGKAGVVPPPHIPEPTALLLLGFGLMRVRTRISGRRK